MRKKKSDLARRSKAARLAKLRRLNEDPAVRLEKLRQKAEAKRAQRLAETPEQTELRRKMGRIYRKQRYAAQAATIKTQKRNAIFEAMKCVQMMKVLIKQREEDEISHEQGVSELNINIKEENEDFDTLCDDDLGEIRLTSDKLQHSNHKKSHEKPPTVTVLNESDIAQLTSTIQPKSSV